MPHELAVIGTSWGGLNAIRTLAGALPPDLPMAVVLVQHRSRESDHLCELVQDCTGLPVSEVVDKQPIEKGRLYVAPADYHLIVETEYFALSVDEPVRFSRPSIDVAFESAADSFGSRCVGVVLTGANEDGARGLARIVARGGKAVVQNPAEAASGIMPKAALEAVPSARVLPLAEIGPYLMELAAPKPEAARRPKRPRARPDPEQRPEDPRP